MAEKLFLYTDGGSRNNPGPAAVGLVIQDTKGNIIEKQGKYIGEYTNNEAEYMALIEGLKVTKNYHPESLVCFLDSQLVVNQLNGIFKVKKAHLAELLLEVKKLEVEFSNIEYRFVKRDKNYLADSLVNQALDSQI